MAPRSSLEDRFAVLHRPVETLIANPVFQSDCAKCHGKDAEGRFMAGRSLISGKATALSNDDIRNMIANGEGRMPKFADKLVAEIKAAKK